MDRQERSFANSVYIVSKKIAKGLESILGGVFAFVFLLSSINVVLRYIFNTSIYGTQEIIDYLFIYLSAIGAAILIQTNEHIQVDFFTKVPIAVRKALRVFQYAVMIALQAFLLQHSLHWIKMVGAFPTPLLHIEQRWAQCAIPACMILGILFSFSKLVELFSKKMIVEDRVQ